MNHFNTSLFTYKYLEYIPYVNKYQFYKNRNFLHLKSFDFKHVVQSSKSLKNSSFFQIIKKYSLEKYFKIICKHYYFHKFGPNLNGPCTRRIKILQKTYNNKKPKKRCCDSLILMTQEEWALPAYKKWASSKSNTKTFLFFVTFFIAFFRQI